MVKTEKWEQNERSGGAANLLSLNFYELLAFYSQLSVFLKLSFCIFCNVSHAVVSGTYSWWPAYPLRRLDQKVLSRLTEYGNVIIRSPFSGLPRTHNRKSTTKRPLQIFCAQKYYLKSYNKNNSFALLKCVFQPNLVTWLLACAALRLLHQSVEQSPFSVSRHSWIPPKVLKLIHLLQVSAARLQQTRTGLGFWRDTIPRTYERGCKRYILPENVRYRGPEGWKYAFMYSSPNLQPLVSCQYSN